MRIERAIRIGYKSKGRLSILFLSFASDYRTDEIEEKNDKSCPDREEKIISIGIKCKEGSDDELIEEVKEEVVKD